MDEDALDEDILDDDELGFDEETKGRFSDDMSTAWQRLQAAIGRSSGVGGSSSTGGSDGGENKRVFDEHVEKISE